MHKWRLLSKITGLSICAGCGTIRLFIEREPAWLKAYGANRAYLYSRKLDYTLSHGGKSVKHAYWNLVHDQCTRDEEEPGDDDET